MHSDRGGCGRKSIGVAGLKEAYGRDLPRTLCAVRAAAQATGGWKIRYRMVSGPDGISFLPIDLHKVIAMVRRSLLVTLLCTPVLGGCSAIQRPDAAADGWLTRVRRQMAQAAREIQADLDFHEYEGLEDFAPNALQQVKAMRSDINGSSGITRERFADNVVHDP